jgi:hypothetical protein
MWALLFLSLTLCHRLLCLWPLARRLAFSHLPWVSIGLVLIFAFFTYDGLSFRRQLDRKFQAMGKGTAEVRPANDVPETIQASYTPSRSCCVEVSTVPSRVGGASVPPKASAPPRPREPPASALTDCASGGEASSTFLRSAAELASSPLSDAGAVEPSAAAQSVRVSGWMYKSPGRLAPSHTTGRDTDEPTEMVHRRPSRRLSATMLAAGRSASAKLLPSLNEGIPTPQDKRYFVLDGHDFRSASAPNGRTSRHPISPPTPSPLCLSARACVSLAARCLSRPLVAWRSAGGIATRTR